MRGRVVHLYDTISIDNPSTPLNEERILSAVLRSDTLGNQSIEIKPAPCNERTIMVVEQLPSIPMTNKQKLKIKYRYICSRLDHWRRRGCSNRIKFK